MVISVCQWLGVAIEMASIGLSSRRLRSSLYIAGLFWVIFSTLPAAASSTFSSMSQSATSSTLGWPVISLMWSLPRPRRPMVATRMVSLGLPKTVVEAAAAAAVVRKKFRRSIVFVTAIRRLLYHIPGISAQKG